MRNSLPVCLLVLGAHLSFSLARWLAQSPLNKTPEPDKRQIDSKNVTVS